MSLIISVSPTREVLAAVPEGLLFPAQSLPSTLTDTSTAFRAQPLPVVVVVVVDSRG